MMFYSTFLLDDDFDRIGGWLSVFFVVDEKITVTKENYSLYKNGNAKCLRIPYKLKFRMKDLKLSNLIQP